MNEDLKQSRRLRGEQASKQQRKASNPLTSVWVEASAGTGKTKVLSDRVLRLLLNGVRPERILCLTYTKAAAVEMSSRIAGRLSRWAVIDDNRLLAELEALTGGSSSDMEKLSRKLFAVLLDTPGGMKIQTIHSFCQEILKRFPLEAKISPYFEVMDDRSSNEALEDVKNRLIQHIEHSPESRAARALGFLTKNVSEYSFPKIMNSIAENRNKIAKLLSKYENVDGLIADLAQTLGIKENEGFDFAYAWDEEKIRKIMQAWFNGSETNQKWAIQLAEILESANPQDLYDKYKSLFLTSDGTIKKAFGTKDAIKYFPELGAVFLSEAERLLELENKIKSAKVFEATKAVMLLADDLICGYRDYKTKHSKMDYEDLIVLTKELLDNKSVADWVLFKLDGGIDHVLIDEAQDTSPNQWEIVKSITQDFFAGKGARDAVRTVFAVGDRKQSIYSFQGADPREFEKSQKHFAEKAAVFENVRLEVSFRSTATVLDLVNNVFGDEVAKKGVVLEGEDITHMPFRIGDAGSIELWQVTEGEKAPEEEGFEHPIKRKTKESASSKLAKEIARNIKQVVESGEILPSQNRPICYKDFLILVQRRNSFVEELVRECKNLNVNIAGIDKIRLLEQIAIQDLIAVGKFLLLPADDLTLATILKSPLFGLDDMDLLKLCHKREGSLWQSLKLSGRAEYEILRELLNRADYMRPFELYSYILNKLKGRKKFVERMGFEVVDGLEEFMNLTLKFEQEHIPTLQGFIGWIMKDEVEIKREQEQSDADAVRIMTVHGAKGLQAPIVVLPDTVRVVASKKESGILWDDLCYYPLGAKYYNDKCVEIKNRDEELSLEEYRRLLYVALTRAEDRLCICGYSSKEASENSWYSILNRKFSEFGTKDDSGKICYKSEQKFVCESKESTKQKELQLPSWNWISKSAVVENPLAKPYNPSIADNDEVAVSPIGDSGENKYRRGILIHKLLQFLPSANGFDRKQLIEKFIAKNAPDIFGKERIVAEILRLFEDERFAVLFGKESKEEVAIIGEVDGRIISAQIDRLVVLEDRVMIVDFKTNRPAAKELADVPPAYLKQLGAYKKLIMKIYPQRMVEAYILWTDVASLMKIA